MFFSRHRDVLGRIFVFLALPMLPTVIRGDTVPEPAQTEQAEPPADQEWEPGFWLESRRYMRQGFVAATAIRASDSLGGIQLEYGIRGHSDEWPGWGALSIFRLSGAGQEVIGARGDMKPWPAAWRWGGAGFLLGLAWSINARTRGPVSAAFSRLEPK
jgi:hypothetical protein